MSVYQGLTTGEFTSEMQAVGFPVLSTESSAEWVNIITARHGGSRFLITLPQNRQSRHIIAQFKKFFLDKPSLANLNRWNYEKRWPRVYASENGELTLDMIFPLVGVDSNYINSIFSLWDSAVQSVIDCPYLE